MLLMILATTAILVAAIVFALLAPARGSLILAVTTGLLFHAMVIASVVVAGLLLRTLAPLVLTVIGLGWLVVAGGLAWRRPEVRGRWPRRLRAMGSRVRAALWDLPTAVAAVLVLGTLAWRLLLAIRLPVVDFDGWSYHLVFADVWVQANALTSVPQRIWTAGYPANMELISTWLMAFTRSDFFVGFSSIFPIPLGVAATASFARLIGATPQRSLLAGLLFGMTPALIAEAGSAYIDAGSVAFVLAAWVLGLRVWRGDRSRSGLAVFGLAAGLALGTKGTNLLLVSPVLAVVGLALLRTLFVDPAARRRGVEAIVLIGLPVAVLGLTWYLKNLLAYGNPFYPFATAGFPGVYPLDALSWSPPALERQSMFEQVVRSWMADWRLTHYVYNVRPGGLGRAWLPILALGLVGAVVGVRRRQLAPLLIVVLPAALAFAAAPNPWYARYTLFLPALAVAFGALAIDRLPTVIRFAGSAALVAVAAISLAYTNLRPNIDVRAAVHRESGWPGTSEYLRLLRTIPADKHTNIGLWHDCAGFAAIPAGVRVAPGGFNLLHGVAGADLEHTLTDPLEGLTTGEEVVRAMTERDTEWLVSSTGSPIDRAAQATPDRFRLVGETCLTARIWHLLPAS